MFRDIQPEALHFTVKEDGCVFTGDAFLPEVLEELICHGGDYDTLIKSIKSKLFVLTPFNSGIFRTWL